MKDLLTYTLTDITGYKYKIIGRFIHQSLAECCQRVLWKQNPKRNLIVERYNGRNSVSPTRRLDAETQSFFDDIEYKHNIRCYDVVMPFVSHHMSNGLLPEEICQKFMQANRIPNGLKRYYNVLFKNVYTDCLGQLNAKKDSKCIMIYDLTDNLPLKVAQVDSEFIATALKKEWNNDNLDGTLVSIPQDQCILTMISEQIIFNDREKVIEKYNKLQEVLFTLRSEYSNVSRTRLLYRFQRYANAAGIGISDSAKLFTMLWTFQDYANSVIEYYNISGYTRLVNPDIDIESGIIANIDLSVIGTERIDHKLDGNGEEKYKFNESLTEFYILSNGWKPGIYLDKDEFNKAKLNYPNARTAYFNDWTKAEEWYNANSMLFGADDGYYVIKKRGVFKNKAEAENIAKQSKKLTVRHFNTYNEAVKWFKVISEVQKEDRVYYAISKGKTTGMFFSYNEYCNAIKDCDSYISDIFPSYQEAKDWLDEKMGTEDEEKITEIGSQIAEILGDKFRIKTFDESSGTKKKESKRKQKKKIHEHEKEIIDEVTSDKIIEEEKNFVEGAKSIVEESNNDVENIPDELEKEVVNDEQIHSADSDISGEENVVPHDESVDRQIDAPLVVFKGIQFDKHLFSSMNNQDQKRFRISFKDRIDRLQRVLSGELRAAGNSLKLIRKTNGKAVLKRRVGKKRMSMFLKDGILTLMRLSNHDRQMRDIHNYRGKFAGYVYYDMPDFIRQMDGYDNLLEKEQDNNSLCTFSEYISNPSHYVYDEDQQSVIDKGEQGENISIIGNAGAGKSIVGLEWLSLELLKENNDCIYLTMSPNLVYTLGYEFDKRTLASDRKNMSQIGIVTTFDFIKEHVHKLYPNIPEKAYLDSAQSLKVFTKFWQENINWQSFWERGNDDYKLYDEASTMLAVWREIHGIIKGALPYTADNIDYNRLNFMPEFVEEEDYLQLLRKEKKNDAKSRNVRWINQLYQTYRRYRDYLKRNELIDDNDMAHMLLKASVQGANLTRYGAAFIDECQDLTQVQLLSLFMLLGRAKIKRLASDRCQMVQPTYFNEGTMRTLVNGYDASIGKDIELAGCRPQYLHYNYRSSRQVIEFQNYLVQSFTYNNILTLHQEELAEIRCPIMAQKGIKPIWISNTDNNKKQLISDLWAKMDRSDLQLILSNKDSSSADAFNIPGKANTQTDVLSCKGMEYPSVLLYNIMSDMRFDQSLAWKYFYVGATRSNNCLIIYEENVADNPVLQEILEDAVEMEIIDKCEDMYGIHAETNELWINYIRRSLGENTPENRLETAESALNYGQYELALDIFQSLDVEQELITYCQGKVNEMYGEYGEAIRIFGTLPENWSNKGRNRQNSVDQMMGTPDIDEISYLGAYMLSGRGKDNLLPKAKEAYERKFGNGKGFYDAFGEAYLKYDFCKGELLNWRDVITVQLDNDVDSLSNNTSAEW